MSLVLHIFGYIAAYLLIGLLFSRLVFRHERKSGSWNNDDDLVLGLVLFLWPLMMVVFGLAFFYFGAKKIVTFDQSQIWKMHWIPRRLKKIQKELEDPPA